TQSKPATSLEPQRQRIKTHSISAMEAYLVAIVAFLMKNTIILSFRGGGPATSDREEYSNVHKRIIRNTVMATKKTVEHRTGNTADGKESAVRIPFELPVRDKAIAGYTKALTHD